jgi:hypothetical protein
MYKFNVYLANGKWTFVEELWSGTDRGLTIGGIEKCNLLYDKTVFLKRMT